MVVDRKELKGKFFRLEELAEMSGFHVDSLRRLVRNGNLRAVKPPHSRAYVVAGEAFLEYLQGGGKEDK